MTLKSAPLIKYSGFYLSYCPTFTNVQVSLNPLTSSNKDIDILFTLKLTNRTRHVLWTVPSRAYITLLETRILVFKHYNWQGEAIHKFLSLRGLLKTNFLLLAGYAIAYKKRFYLAGQVNRLKALRRRKLILQLGYTHKIRIRGLRFLSFRRWRRKKFGIRIKSNQANFFHAFIDLFRHLRLRGQYTSRGIRLRKDRFKMKFRPDHGKYGFKMNY